MFDFIKCDYPLPDGHKPTGLFQTKNLECMLDTYTITKRGILKHGNTKVQFSGDLSFYFDYGKGQEIKWKEYLARIDNGKVQLIVEVNRPEFTGAATNNELNPEEMDGWKDGNFVAVRLHGEPDTEWHVGRIIGAKKKWVQLSDMIADEDSIMEWRLVVDVYYRY